MDKRTEHIGRVFLEVASRILENREKPRKYGTGRLLYPSEIKTLFHLGEKPGLSVTELAEISGVTKGAVSQLLNRLDSKGMVIRKEDPSNLSRINIHLTPLGRKAYRGKKAFEKQSHRALAKHLNEMTASELEILERFLNAAKFGIS